MLEEQNTTRNDKAPVITRSQAGEPEGPWVIIRSLGGEQEGLFVRGNVGGNECNLLIDTGSGVTLLRPDIWKKDPVSITTTSTGSRAEKDSDSDRRSSEGEGCC